MSEKKDEQLRSDKLRDLILIVYLNNRFDKEKNRIPWLKEKLDYSTGGLYSALDNSGYFERKTDEIVLTEKGMTYLNKHILPQHTAFYPFGNILIILGFIFLLQWIYWTYFQITMFVPWYSAVIIIAAGVLIRFFYFRFNYWFMKRTKTHNNQK